MVLRTGKKFLVSFFSQTVNLFIQLRYKDVYVFIKSGPPISRKIQNLALRYMGGNRKSRSIFFIQLGIIILFL